MLPVSKKNILVNVKVENTDTILDELKSSLRLLKGNLVETTKISNEEEVNFKRTHISERGRSRSRGRRECYSRSFSRGREGSRPTGSFRDERGRSKDRSGHRTNFNRSYSGQGRSQSRGRFNRDRQEGFENRYEHVNLVLKEEEETHLEEERNMMILDSGTTKTVAGSKWMTDYLQTRDQEELKSISRTTDYRFFRFVNSVRYPSTEEITIPIKLGRLDTFIKVSIVKAPFGPTGFQATWLHH